MARIPEKVKRGHGVVVGVDTHKYIHVAVAVDGTGARIGERSLSADRAGYRELEVWALSLAEPDGRVEFGIEGTGSYGAGLASHLRRAGHRVVEVMRPARQDRHVKGKDDTLDADSAARQTLAGTATAVPKSADGPVEMIRQLKVARDTAVTSRTTAVITLKTVLVNAPAELREQLEPLPDKALLAACRDRQHRHMRSPADAATYAMAGLANRYAGLETEVHLYDLMLAGVVKRTAPALLNLFGVGVDCAAELLIVAGDNPERITSEAAYAKLCGACPIPASSGNTTRHRLYRGGHRQANAALHRIVVCRMKYHQPTIDYVQRRTAEGKTKPEIMRCLKRAVARQIYHVLISSRTQPETAIV